ncbi:MAG: CPBP family intramembrane metalloprotease [Cyclobacteriaceae bacterium]|nr:CPBP family intramembrane metalloprotease [Cyclobacteriaceae bacterium]
MIILLQELVNAVVAVAATLFLSCVFFTLRANKELSFRRYIGLYWPPLNAIRFVFGPSILFTLLAIGMIYVDEGLRQMVVHPPSIAGRIRVLGLGIEGIAVSFIQAFLTTSFAEEVLFRGLLGKRLTANFGFYTGNATQALVFGGVHVLMICQLVKPTSFAMLFVFCLTSVSGAVLGIIKEKYSEGSLIPGWIAHGSANAVSYVLIAFVL